MVHAPEQEGAQLRGVSCFLGCDLKVETAIAY